MRHRTTITRLFAVLFALALLAAACGDDDSSSDADTGTDTTQDGTTQDDTTGEGTTGSDTGGDEPSGDAGPAGAPSADCLEAVAAFQAAQAEVGTAMTGQAGDLDVAKQQIDALADNAPDEIADEFRLYAEEVGKLLDALAGLDFEGGIPSQEQMEEMSQLGDDVDQQALEEASEAIAAYYEELCPSAAG